jgi:predicted nuclease with TOPRIM domain
MIEIKTGLLVAGLGIFTLTAITESSENKEPECRVDIDALEDKIDKRLIEQSAILGTTAIVKDSSVKVLHKECKTLKTEVKVLKVENRTLKSEVSQLASRNPDTVLRTVYVKKGLFGKETFDTVE